VRGSTSVLVVAFLAGSLGAAVAQSYPPPLYYPPPPPGYYPPPPEEYYPAPPQPYDDDAPVPPASVGAPYAPDYVIQAEEPPGPYSPTDAPYLTPADRTRPPTRPSLGWEQPPRPPAGIGAAGSSADVTGSVRSPPAATGSAPDRATVIAALPPEDRPETGPAAELPTQFHRQLVDYVTTEPAGTIIIDTPHTYLYLVRGGGKALRYGVGVGREGFTWSGTERISHMSEWPDWHPPKEMIERQPYLPRFMAGGEGNPLGARALYLGNTVYRIHGTNQPSTIGHFVSSGCIRLTNADVEDLYSRIGIGTRVVVLPGSPPASASAQGPITH